MKQLLDERQPGGAPAGRVDARERGSENNYSRSRSSSPGANVDQHGHAEYYEEAAEEQYAHTAYHLDGAEETGEKSRTLKGGGASRGRSSRRSSQGGGGPSASGSGDGFLLGGTAIQRPLVDRSGSERADHVVDAAEIQSERNPVRKGGRKSSGRGSPGDAASSYIVDDSHIIKKSAVGSARASEGHNQLSEDINGISRAGASAASTNIKEGAVTRAAQQVQQAQKNAVGKVNSNASADSQRLRKVNIGSQPGGDNAVERGNVVEEPEMTLEERATMWALQHKRAMEQRAKLKQEKDEAELKNCTFRPNAQGGDDGEGGTAGSSSRGSPGDHYYHESSSKERTASSANGGASSSGGAGSKATSTSNNQNGGSKASLLSIGEQETMGAAGGDRETLDERFERLHHEADQRTKIRERARGLLQEHELTEYTFRPQINEGILYLFPSRARSIIYS